MEVIPLSQFVVPEVLEVQEIPSEEVSIVPESPTAMNVLFECVTPESRFVVPEVLKVHVAKSEEVNIVPASPTAT